MIENRLIHRLETYWNMLRKEKAMPDFAQFNASAISDIWQQCVLFTVQPASELAPPALSFHTIGEKLYSIYDKEMLGRTISASRGHFQGAAIVRRVNEIITTPDIIFDEGQFINEHSKTVKYRSCLLPFGSRDGRVTHMIVGLSWREY